MPFVLMAIMSGGVTAWLFGLPLRRAPVQPEQAAAGSPGTGRGRHLHSGFLPVRAQAVQAGTRGWLFVYVVMLGVQALHSLGLAIAAPIVEARPSLAGLSSFVPVPSLAFYEVTNLALVLYTVALYALMARRRKSAIAHNVICNALGIAFLVCWHFLGMKSGFGTVADSIPGVVGICYILASGRVRNTFVVT